MKTKLVIAQIALAAAASAFIACGGSGKSDASSGRKKIPASDVLKRIEASKAGGSNEAAKKDIEWLKENYPDAAETKTAEAMLPDIAAAIDKTTKEEKEKQQQAAQQAKLKLDAALAQMNKKRDDMEHITWYRDKTTSPGGRASNLSLYFGVSDGNALPNRIRMICKYFGDSWLFIECVKVDADGEQFLLTPDEVKHDNDSKIVEWFDEQVSPDQAAMIEKIISAKNVTLRYQGKEFYRDRKLSSAEKTAMGNVLTAYKGSGGKL